MMSEYAIPGLLLLVACVLNGCVIEGVYEPSCRERRNTGNRSTDLQNLNEEFVNMSTATDKDADEVKSFETDTYATLEVMDILIEAAEDAKTVKSGLKKTNDLLKVLALMPFVGTQFGAALKVVKRVTATAENLLKQLVGKASLFEQFKNLINTVVLPPLLCASKTLREISKKFKELLTMITDLMKMAGALLTNALLDVLYFQFERATDRFMCLFDEFSVFPDKLLEWDFRAVAAKFKSILGPVRKFGSDLKSLANMIGELNKLLGPVSDFLNKDFEVCVPGFRRRLGLSIPGTGIDIPIPTIPDLCVSFSISSIAGLASWFKDAAEKIIFDGLCRLGVCVDKLLSMVDLPVPELPEVPSIPTDVEFPELPLPQLPTLKFRNITAATIFENLLLDVPIVEDAKCSPTFELVGDTCSKFQETGAICPPLFELDGAGTSSKAFVVVFSLLTGMLACWGKA